MLKKMLANVLFAFYFMEVADAYRIFSNLVRPLISADGHFFEI